MNRNRIQSVGWMAALLLALASPVYAQRVADPFAVQRAAVLSGVVRDSHGSPQAGALVQLLITSSANPFDNMMNAVTAITDNHGRYSFGHLLPGVYEVRASAALFLPALHDNLRLASGSRTIVNMTLSTLFEASEWLPAQRRRADEADDDWKWTLRSTVKRPLLRLAGDSPLTMSTSAAERSKPETHGRMAMTSGNGGFAGGGMHSIFTMDRVLDDGSGVLLRADLATAQGRPVAPSADLSVGYQRRVNYNTTARMVTGFSSHPELVNSSTSGGMQGFLMESGEQMQLSEALGVDVGVLMTAVQIGNNGFATQPYLKVVARPADSLLVTYRMATSRLLQGTEDMDSIDLGTPLAGVQRGKVRIESGLHQEVSVGKRTGRGMVQAAWYHDRISNPIVHGGGPIGATALASGNYVVDPATESFRVVGANYSGSGVNVSASEPLCESLWAVVDYSTGTVLAFGDPEPGTPGMMGPVRSQTASVALRGHMAKTNTHLRAAYRWQPQHTITAVNSYHAFSDQSYLSFYVRQPLHLRGILPRGMEATIDVTNLLAQGYQPIATDGDGHAIYFAQSARTLEAGLSFTF
ncbi:MAG TPA: carboxypeptidase-like regulatory domain-containing protein [Acidobacteriaceae bacterium]